MSPDDIRALRTAHALSQQGLADTIGAVVKTDRVTVARWETGRHPPDQARLYVACEELGEVWPFRADDRKST